MKIGYEAKRVFHNATGLGNYSRELIRILSEYYPENTYFLYNPKQGKVRRFVPNHVNVFEKRPDSLFGKIFSTFWRQRGIVRQIAADRIDLFHGLSGELPAGLSSKRIKCVVTIHDLIFLRFPHFYSFFDRKIHFKKMCHAVHAADAVIAVSAQTKRDIIEFLRVPHTKIHVIYQGCHSVFKRPATEARCMRLRETYRLPEKFVLHVGTIEKRKNVLALVKALSESEIPIVIVGRETQYARRVRKFIRANQMQHRVFIINGLSLEDLAALYQMATLFVYPSIFEGFGIPIVEALFSKTPVITSTGSCFEETGGPHSIYVDPNDTEELRAQVHAVWHDGSLQQTMIQKGLEYVQRCNDETIANKIISLYNSMVS